MKSFSVAGVSVIPEISLNNYLNLRTNIIAHLLCPKLLPTLPHLDDHYYRDLVHHGI